MLLESWQPVTHDFGLIQAPLETVVRALREWHSGIGIRYRRAEISGGLEAVLTALLPLSTGMQRKLFVLDFGHFGGEMRGHGTWVE